MFIAKESLPGFIFAGANCEMEEWSGGGGQPVMNNTVENISGGAGLGISFKYLFHLRRY